MSGKNRNKKRGKSSQLKNRIKKLVELGVTPKQEKEFKKARSQLNELKKDMKKLGGTIDPYIPRVTNFKYKEDILNLTRAVKQFLKNPIVTGPTHKHKIPLKLIEQERKLVEKYNKPIREFTEEMGRRKIKIGGVEEEQTVKEYLEQYEGNKDYTMTEQWRYLTKKELEKRVNYLKRKTKKNSMFQRMKMAKKNYLKAMETEGLDRTPEGKKLHNKIKRMKLKRFMDVFSVDVEASITFMYDDNLDINDRLSALSGAWKNA